MSTQSLKRAGVGVVLLANLIAGLAVANELRASEEEAGCLQGPCYCQLDRQCASWNSGQASCNRQSDC